MPNQSTPLPPPPPIGISPDASSLPPKSTPKIIPVLLGLLVVVIVAVLGFFAFRRFSPSGSTITLTYWGLWEPESVMQPVFAQYQKTHPNIKINYQMQSPEEYRERLQSALSQGKAPDIFRLHNTWIPMFKNDLSSVPPTVYSAAAYESTFYPVTRSDLRVGSSYVAIPLEYDGLAMFINLDLLRSSGQQPPKNWEDLATAAVAMSRCQNDQGVVSNCSVGGSRIVISGAALGTTDNVDHWSDILGVLMLQNNVNLARPDSPSPKAAQDALDYYTSFAESYHIWDSSLPTSTNYFSEGKVGIYFAPSWRYFDIKSANPKLNFAIYPLPQLPVDPSRGESPITWASYWAEAVNKKSPNAKAAWELLQYLSSKDVQSQIYQLSISPTRSFGEPFSRVDLAASVTDSSVTPFLQQAPLARSWYLASFTREGPSGINSRMISAFADAVTRKSSLPALSKNISKILSDYGLAAPQTGAP